MIEGSGGGNVGYHEHAKNRIVDTGEIKSEIAKKQKHLRDFSPKEFTGKDRDKYYKKAKKYARWIHENMPPNKEHKMMYPKGVGTARSEVNFDQAVQNQVKWQLNGQKVVEAYKHIMRRLDPQNPTITNIERLRRA